MISLYNLLSHIHVRESTMLPKDGRKHVIGGAVKGDSTLPPEKLAPNTKNFFY